MKYRDFRDFKIIRTCTKTYRNHESYKSALEKDFHLRCAYCNLLKSFITTPFEVDHFIPEDTFKGKKDYLKTQYDNLVLSCKKCNIAKNNMFEGDINCSHPKNERFYDPVETDYNDIFYRTEYGAIASEDDKGRQSINDLKLYRPIHTLAWICEETSKLIEKFNKKIENELDPKRKKALEHSRNELLSYHNHRLHIFIANYNNKKFQYDNDNTVFAMDELCHG